MLSVGDVVGRYTLHRQIGQRGQGKVFLAFDERGVQVALKIPHVGNVDRFRKELAAAQGIESSHVARVWDYDLSGCPPYIAYQVVPGEPLDAALENRDLSTRQLASIFRDVASGLADIHRVSSDRIPQLSHGDVTLDNIMVTDRDAAVIIDLGAARLGKDSSLSRDLFGKMGYFSPEQLEGLTYGPPADVWQLGISIARAATGHMPFGSDHKSITCILDDIPNLNGLPRSLARIVVACLKKDPLDRASASDIVGRFTHLLESRYNGIGMLSTVKTIQFDIDADGLLQRRAKCITTPPGQFRAGPRVVPDVAIGDIIADRSVPYFPRSLRPPDRQPVEAPETCPGCGTALVSTAGNWRTTKIRCLGHRISDDQLYCPAGYACRDQLEDTLLRFARRTNLRSLLRPVLCESAANNGLTPARILAGATAEPGAGSSSVTDTAAWAMLDDERCRFARELREGPSAIQLLSALGLPGHEREWGRSRPSVHDLLGEDLDSVLPLAEEHFLPTLRGWWEERRREVHAAVRAVIPA